MADDTRRAEKEKRKQKRQEIRAERKQARMDRREESLKQQSCRIDYIKEIRNIEKELWGRYPVSRESRRGINNIVSDIKAKGCGYGSDSLARARVQMDGYAQKDIADAKRKAQEDEERQQQRIEEKERSRELKDIRKYNMGLLSRAVRELWEGVSFSRESKVIYDEYRYKIEKMDSKMSDPYYTYMYNELKPYALEDLKKDEERDEARKRDYEAKHYEISTTEVKDEEGNVIGTASTKRKKTFCEVHPSLCNAKKSVKEGILTTAGTIDKGLTVAGEAIVKTTKKAVDYMTDEPSSSRIVDDDAPKTPKRRSSSSRSTKEPEFDPWDVEEETPRPPKEKPKQKQAQKSTAYTGYGLWDTDTKEDRPKSSKNRPSKSATSKPSASSKKKSTAGSGTKSKKAPAKTTSKPSPKRATAKKRDDDGLPPAFSSSSSRTRSASTKKTTANKKTSSAKKSENNKKKPKKKSDWWGDGDAGLF